MVDRMVGEEESNNDDATGSPMWKFLSDEYDYKRPKRGDIRYAEVLRIDDDEIIVDIGGKTEGVVPKLDLERMGEDALAEIEVGDKVPVYVLRPESADGDVIVSLNMARTMEDWRKAEKLFEDGEVFEGTVAGHNKGGLLVYFGQIRGFVPASQLSGLSRRSGHEERLGMLSKMEGQQLLLKVIEVDRQRRRLIFSERAASREWRDQRKDELLDQLQEGDIRSGKVRNLCEFGAFVDLGGADGLIHISELSWRRVKHARDVLNVGEEVEVYVLRVDRDRKRIGLSLKRLQPDPWHVAEEKYEVGQIVKGTVTNIVDFGAFARIDDGIEGLIHVTELSDGDFAPRDLVREGEELYVKILSVDADRQRMGLSLKQAPSREEVEGEEAWAEIAEEGEAEEEPALDASLAEPEEPLAVEPEMEVEAELAAAFEDGVSPEVVAEEEPALDASLAETEEEPTAQFEPEEPLAVEPETEVEAGFAAVEEGVSPEVVAEEEPALDVSLAETEEEPMAQFEPEVPLSVEAEMEVDAELAAAVEEGVSAEAEAVIAEVAVEVEDRGLEPELEQAPSQEEPEVEEPAGDGEWFELEPEAEQDEELPVDVESVIPTAPEAEVLAEEEAEAESKSEAEEEEALNDTVVSEEQADESNRPEELVGVATEADSDEADLTPDESTAVDPDETEQDEDV
ncbi:MAG TPA: S1 RNA-binding domain-containing protein [Anaerolineae bacterium]|nr:S1 RNA-binding domain-containing protein [Anaerolineae bacterium]